MGEFTLLGFAAHTAAMVGEIDFAEREALERVGNMVLEEIRESAGEYQPASGPFEAWAPLAEATQDDRVSKGYPADEPELRDGTLRDSYEKTVTKPGFAKGGQVDVGSNLDIAEYQELGTENMPPRSISGGALVRREGEVVRVLGESYVSALMVGSGSAIAGSFLPIRRP